MTNAVDLAKFQATDVHGVQVAQGYLWLIDGPSEVPGSADEELGKPADDYGFHGTDVPPTDAAFVGTYEPRGSFQGWIVLSDDGDNQPEIPGGWTATLHMRGQLEAGDIVYENDYWRVVVIHVANSDGEVKLAGYVK